MVARISNEKLEHIERLDEAFAPLTQIAKETGISVSTICKYIKPRHSRRPKEDEPLIIAGHNKNTIGICLIGKDVFTTEQYEVLTYLVDQLVRDNPDSQVVGHYELDPKKTCPNFDVQSWWAEAKKSMSWG